MKILKSLKNWLVNTWDKFCDWYTHEHDPRTEMKDEGLSDEHQDRPAYEFIIIVLALLLAAYIYFCV